MIGRRGPGAAMTCAAVTFVAAFAWNAAAVDAESPATQAAGQRVAGGYVGEQTCLSCHIDQRVAGPHAHTFYERTPAATEGCESCHGPGQQHAESGDPAQIRRFDAIAPSEASDTCTTCHNRASHALWDGSQHDPRIEWLDGLISGYGNRPYTGHTALVRRSIDSDADSVEFLAVPIDFSPSMFPQPRRAPPRTLVNGPPLTGTRFAN